MLCHPKADKGNILELRLEPENVPMWGKNESRVWRISIDILLLSIHLTKSRLWANGVFRITGFCFKCPTLFPYCTEVKVIISNKTTTNSNRWYDRSTINNWQSNQSAHCICGQQNSTRYFFPEGKHIVSDDRKLKNCFYGTIVFENSFFMPGNPSFFHVLHWEAACNGVN